MQKNHFLLLKKLKHTEGAQLWQTSEIFTRDISRFKLENFVWGVLDKNK